ncbi:MAG: hypothetical protein J0G94_03795 [Sphingomonadales bacterium]|nr:hypothetical protein [Sphingomonadales bacterium]
MATTLQPHTPQTLLERLLGARGARPLLLAGCAGVVVLAMPPVLLEQLFEPSIGLGSRMMLAGAVASMTGAIVWAFGASGRDSGDRSLKRHRRDRHPDAPPRPPLYASRDLPPAVPPSDPCALSRLPRAPEPLSDEEIARLVAALPPRRSMAGRRDLPFIDHSDSEAVSPAARPSQDERLPLSQSELAIRAALHALRMTAGADDLQPAPRVDTEIEQALSSALATLRLLTQNGCPTSPRSSARRG